MDDGFRRQRSLPRGKSTVQVCGSDRAVLYRYVYTRMSVRVFVIDAVVLLWE